MNNRDNDQGARARRIVEQQKVAERRRRASLWTSVGVVLILVIAGLVGWASTSRNKGKLVTPSVAVDEGTAFAFGTGAVLVDVYEDFMCPVCNEFEKETGPTIKQLVAANKITLRFHPVSILDRASNGTRYSTRAANAAAAAAVDGKFVEYHDVLYANQPKENSNGLTDAKLIELGKSVGLGDTFAKAVSAETYSVWAGKVTDTFSARGYNGTPTIVVNGKQVTGPNDTMPNTAVFTQAVTAAAG